MILRRLLRPEFVYRPRQAIRAVWQKLAGDPQGTVEWELPWGLPVHVRTDDFIGQRVIRHGLVALAACEVAFRLLDAGHVGVDVGANHGIVTAAMAASVGSTGRVIAVEMHPVTYAALECNVRCWARLAERIAIGSVDTVCTAASDRRGSLIAVESSDFLANTGVGYVTRENPGESHRNFSVPCDRLDRILCGQGPIHLLKLDVERHEFEALTGCGELIRNHSIPHIVFEDADLDDTPPKQLLLDAGYKIYKLHCRLLGPALVEINASERPAGGTDCYVDYLATIDRTSVEGRFRRRGYLCLRGPRSSG